MAEQADLVRERLRMWMSGGCAGPYKLQLNPTNACNLSCATCLARGKAKYKPSEEVPEDRYISLLDEAAALGVAYCDICGGGEPFASSATINIMAGIKSRGLVGTIITNATLLTEETLKRIVGMRWDFFNISLEGPCAEANDPIRGAGTFRKAVAAISTLNRHKRKLASGLPHLSVYTVVNRMNYDKLGQYANFAISNSIEGVYFQPLTVSDGRGKGLILSEEEAGLLRKGLLSLDLTGRGIKTNINHLYPQAPGKQEPVPGAYCHSPWLVVTIRADGVCGMCPPSVEYLEGVNIKDMSLRDAWFSPVFSGFRKSVEENRRPGCCSRCGSMEKIAQKEIARMTR